MVLVARQATTSAIRHLAKELLYLLFLDTISQLYRCFKRNYPRPFQDSAHQGPDFLEEFFMKVEGNICILEQMGHNKGLFDKLVDDLITHVG